MAEVFRGGKVHVLRDKCSSCIFRSPKDGQIMGLQEGRITGMVKEARNTVGGNIPCHQTIYTDEVRPAICRGFWDLPDRDPLLQLAVAKDIVEYDNPPTKEH